MMTGEKIADVKSEYTFNETNEAENISVRFCLICETKISHDERYGFLCWTCSDCDFDEPGLKIVS